MADTLYALTLKQPWPVGIANGKPVENRSWVTHYRGPLALHAGAGMDARDGDRGEHAVRFVADRTGLPMETVWHGSQLRSAVFAVVDFTDVCSGSRFIHPASPLRCGCGAWGASAQRHFLFADVRVLPEPVPCRGRQRLWRLPEDVDAKVRAQLDLESV
jgi:hypothetical protein